MTEKGEKFERKWKGGKGKDLITVKPVIVLPALSTMVAVNDVTCLDITSIQTNVRWTVL